MHPKTNAAPAPLAPAEEHPGTRALWSALLAGLDRCAQGVALLDAGGRRWFANAAARLAFQRLGWSAGALPLGPQAAAWTAALDQVCHRGRRELLELDLAPPRHGITVALMPVAVPGARLAFALFGRDDICGSVELQQFALHHRLTGAETQVLGLLCKGLAAADIARTHGVTKATVLTQIAAIRAKTQCTSVRALLAEMARMPQLVPLLGVL
ncbi:helix-turn-helix transcriptional regulator [Pseudorhodoferax sp.]|uniref:helix-turn-helix transcriptional regulator n=1 Tax=Pseudorhodoferax sp. TaxID=1993553 RepID=UPI0039E3F4D7